MSPFQAVAKAVANVQGLFAENGQRTGGAMLDIFKTKVPCSHSPILDDFNLIPGGQSPKLFIEVLEFLASDVGNAKPRKGEKCVLTLRPGTPPVKLRLWQGGLLPGGYLYRFQAVDENFNA